MTDELTEECHNDALENPLETGYDLNNVQKWIVRTPASSTSGKWQFENAYQYYLKIPHHAYGSRGESRTCLCLE